MAQRDVVLRWIQQAARVIARLLRSGKPGLIEFLYEAALRAYVAKEEQLGDESVRQSVERFVMLRTIDQTVRAEPVFQADIIDPIDVLGVDKLIDGGVTIRARIKTLHAGGQV